MTAKWNRGVVGVLALTTVTALTLSACGSSTAGSGTSSSTPSSSTSSTTGTSSSTSSAAVSSSAQTSSAAGGSGSGKTITVWLQSDAQKGWPDVVTQATQRFTAATGAQVKVEWQQWANYTTKLDSTFAGSTAIPDVVELGNTQTSSYIAGGAFTDISADKSTFENSGTWLKGLEESGTSPDGKLYAVPYYAGSRVVIYRKDLWAKAGVTAVPTTLDEMFADLDKVKAANASDKAFSTFYMPGKYWYAAMSFVYGAGGTIATSDGGKWTGGLTDAKAQQGLAAWAKLATTYSVGGATKDESDQDGIFAQGHTGAILGNGWEVGSITDPKTGKPSLAADLGTFPLPGTAASTPTPSFLGGSDLAVPQKASNADLGVQWIKYYTDTASQTALAKFAIPNTTSLLDVYAATGAVNASTAAAAKSTWFVPNTPNWANVESGNVLQNMLTAIATGTSASESAASAADDQIATILNAS